MKIQYLVSTMHRKNIEFISSMNIEGDILIINQCDNNEERIGLKEEKVEILSYHEKGLSKSRNRALQNARNDICVLSDDDLVYSPNASKIILNAYKKYDDADIIVFQINNSKGELYKKYNKKACRINLLNCMKVSSVEITFKREQIMNKGIIFNEKFGAGSYFSCGEENIFLKECLKKGLKVMYTPQVIASLQDSESSWFKGYNRSYFRTKGAFFYEMSQILSLLFIIRFAICKRKIYKKDIGISKAIKYMVEGLRMNLH